MRIGELARRTGLAPSAIRYYEDRDMFSPGQIVRLPNGYRDYTDAAQQRIELILAGRAAGFSLDRMRTQMQHWIAMDPGEKSQILSEQLARLDEQIRALERSRAAVASALQGLRAHPPTNRR
ncbi:MerR family transcriptional regulator [Gordonia sp. ABSL1-1]|uniref:MerR family transcriptional regulator n=1 Tax=Gordonia sp. ABSL1-1 TaxID=3053923 RepID=UPI0025744CA0|nr:MerR family transcriptional regulator [Gordonia sp. ABSL1-1]MDL9937690.1 MerR family transcriptional regulator [Gordonia sp. ABSL1-1]